MVLHPRVFPTLHRMGVWPPLESESLMLPLTHCANFSWASSCTPCVGRQVRCPWSFHHIVEQLCGVILFAQTAIRVFMCHLIALVNFVGNGFYSESLTKMKQPQTKYTMNLLCWRLKAYPLNLKSSTGNTTAHVVMPSTKYLRGMLHNLKLTGYK